jgi:hypothetical protein
MGPNTQGRKQQRALVGESLVQLFGVLLLIAPDFFDQVTHRADK